MHASAVMRFSVEGMSLRNSPTSLAVEMCKMCRRVLDFSANSTAMEDDR